MTKLKSKIKIPVVQVLRTDEKSSGQFVITPVSPTLEYKQTHATVWEMLDLKDGESCTLKVTRLSMTQRAIEKLQEIEEL